MGVFLEELKVTETIQADNILWNSKPLLEGSVLLWDLENIPFHRLEDIKKVAKYTPQDLYIVSKDSLGEKLLKKIHKEHFKVLNAHKGISDSKIISIMKLYGNRENLMLVSSDSDFAREANKYLKKGKLQWIVVENVKKRVLMKVNLASANLTLSTLAHKPSKSNKQVIKKNSHKQRHKRVGQNRDSAIVQKEVSQLSLYLDYSKEKVKRVIKRVKKLYRKARYHFRNFFPKEEIPAIENIEVNNPVEGKREIYRRNLKGKRVRAGTLQFREDKESILLLYKNLSTKYIMPPFKKRIFFYEFTEIENYIHFNVKEQEYYLNDFARKSYDEVISQKL